MGLIVDTSVLVETERRSNRLTGSELASLLLRTGESDFGISVVTLSELVYGHAYNFRLSEEVKAQSLEDLRTVFAVYVVTEQIARLAGKLNAVLRTNGTPVGLADVLIAATALEFGYKMLTHNWRHFSYVPGLEVLNAANL